MLQVETIKPNLLVRARAVERPSQRDGVQGLRIGMVEQVEASRYIKLKSEGSIDGKHHWIPLEWVADVDDKAVYLNKTPEEVTRGLLNDNPLYRH